MKNTLSGAISLNTSELTESLADAIADRLRGALDDLSLAGRPTPVGTNEAALALSQAAAEVTGSEDYLTAAATAEHLARAGYTFVRHFAHKVPNEVPQQVTDAQAVPVRDWFTRAD